jgi:hypothetical protein
VHGAFVGHFHESLPLLIAERALQCNGAIDVIEHADFGVAAFAIVDMDSAVA